MRPSRISLRFFFTAVALFWSTAVLIFGQGITTSAVTGQVTDSDGKPVAGAAVLIVHEESGTQASTTTRPNGQYNATGLRPGGPYTVTVTSPGSPPVVQTGLYLGLERADVVNFNLPAASEVVQLEKFTVRETQDATFGIGKMSTGSDFTASQIENTPSVRRSVQDLAQLDTRIVVMSLDQGGNLSAQGQNFRFNSFLIDGVQANDPYGINGNGFSSLRSPIPPEAIESLSFSLNPYDVRRSGFTGVLINAVTKSGTNRFSGSVYTEYTDKKMRAKNPLNGAREPFHERTYGATLGGPILPNRLFFFLAYDDFERSAAPPTANLVLAGSAADPASQVGQIVDRAKSFGYDPGSFAASSVSKQKTYLAKLDWNITKAHRLSYTFRKNDGLEPSFPGFTSSTSTSFSNYWFDQPRITNSYKVQLFSNWSPNLRTEASFGHSNYNGSPINKGPAFPEVFIRGLTGTRIDNGQTITTGSVNFGTEFSRQLNVLVTKTDNALASGEYSIGDHTIVVGGDYQRTHITNKFVQAYYGSYTFNTLSDWLSGIAPTFSQVVLAPGTTVENTFADFPYTVLGAFVQDTWKPTRNLSVSAGLRLDYPYVPTSPVPIPTTAAYSEAAFQSAFGRSSTTSNDGNYTIAPRIGFNYELNTERKTQLRGGLGLFQGSNPAVWLANAYQNRGVAARVSSSNVAFSPTISSPTGAFPSTAVAVVNVTDPDFKSPVSWKGNLGMDHAVGGGWIFTMEYDKIQVDRALTTQNLNLLPVGTNPDGRIRYAGAISSTTTGASRTSASAAYSNNAFYRNPGFADVYLLTNTGKGGGNDFSLAFGRPMKNNWSAGIAWTFGKYKEVSPATSSVAQSNYNARAIFNPNEDVASISNTNITDKIVATLTYQFKFIKKAPTTLSLVYQGRTGHPYSYVFYADANGDGFTFNDLLYVPNGPDDPKVRWNSTSERDAFFAFARSSGLMNYAGSVAPRNGERSPWTQTIDLKLTQTLPIYKRVRSEIYLNFLNIANFFDKNMGLLEEVPFSYRRAVASTTYDATANQYVYNFNATTLDPVPTVANDQPVSRWQIQTGIRLRF